MKFLFTFFLLVAFAALGLANKLPNVTAPALPSSIPTEDPITLIGELSPQCQAAFLSIITSPEFFECVPVTALLPLLTDPTLLPSILKDPIANAPKLLPVVDAICAAPKCSDKGIAGAISAVKEGCSADLKDPLVPLALGVLEFYSPVRDIICFKDNKDEYCVVESVTKILTLPTPPFKLLGGIIDKVATAEPKFICTPCNKAIVNTLLDFFKEHPEALELIENLTHIGEEEFKLGELFLTVKCGFQFLDGKVPDPSKIDPNNFNYQVADSDENSSNKNEMSVMIIGSILASALILN